MDWRGEQEQRVSEFIHRTRWSDLPARVVRQAKRCLLDLYACTYAGLDARSSAIARRFAVSLGGREESRLFGETRRVPLPLAVYANTTACEALDCDDGYNLIKGHPGAFLFPVILGFADRQPLSGSETLEALVVGYEVGIRAGLLVRALYPSYHGSGSWGGVGAAAIAARLLGLTEEATRHALGIAEYHGTLAPIMRCVELPGMVKDGIAWSAFSAVCGALQAEDGFTSTPSLFGSAEAEGLVDSLGSEWLIEGLYFKPYCCCRWAQPAVRAALGVVRSEGIDPETISGIRVETFAEACALTRQVPKTSEEAQYSVAWPVAMALLHGDVGPAQVLESALGDARGIALMKKVGFRHRADFQAEFPGRRLAEVVVEAEGRSISSGPVAAHGDPADPLTDEEMESKFHRYTARHLDEKAREELIRSVQNLEKIEGGALCRS